MTVIVDTNVVVVANNREADHASAECVLSCVRILNAIINNEKIALDDANRILNEYKYYSNRTGQPGVGDRFFQWILLNQTTGRIDFIPIHSSVAGGENERLVFEEFPTDARLNKFDTSDRMFVAVARVHPEHPPILNAVDTDWWNFRDVLAENGIEIEFLCLDDVRRFAKSP